MNDHEQPPPAFPASEESTVENAVDDAPPVDGDASSVTPLAPLPNPSVEETTAEAEVVPPSPPSCDDSSVAAATEPPLSPCEESTNLEDKDVPPPPPPMDSDDESVSSCSSSSTANSDASSIDRGRLMLPNLFQRINGIGEANFVGLSALEQRPPSPSNGKSSPTPVSSRSIGRGMLLLPSILARSSGSEEENSVSLEEEGQEIEPDAADRASSPPPPIASTSAFDRFPVPAYKDENRMLMRSPLPSPRNSPKRIIPRPRTLAEDSDSEDGRWQREETNMKRLVNMAKQQQNFAAAWFAASAGEEPMLPALVARSKRRKRVRPSTINGRITSSSSSSSSGPVDLDNGQEWKDADDMSQTSCSTTSSGSSRMRSFLERVLPSSSSINPVAPNDSKRTGDGATVTPSTGSPNSSNGHVIDLEAATTSTNAHNKRVDQGFCISKPSLYVILAFLIFSIVAIVVASLLYVKQKRGRRSAPAQRFNTAAPTVSFAPTQSPTVTPFPSFSPTTFAPTETPPSESPSQSLTTTPTIPPEPTIAPSGVPSASPSMFPSATPSMEPTASPSASPSMTPSATPSFAPSSTPSASPSTAPSVSPTISQAPSSSPSVQPTTDFSTTIFERLGSALEGDIPREHYGNSIALSSNGKVLAVGARHFEQDGKRRAGRVHVFDYLDDDTWALRGGDEPLVSLFGRNDMDQFGYVVALSDDGNRLAVSEPGFDGPAGDRSGNVRVFDWMNGSWVQVGNDVGGQAATDLFGLSLALSGNGQRLVVGAPYHDNDAGSLAGHVRIFEFSTSTDGWEPLGGDLDGTRELDWFGWDVDLDYNGNMVAVGAPRNSEYGGYVRCFSFQQDAWKLVGNDIVNDFGLVQLDDRFGLSVSLSSNGERVAVGAPWKDGNSKSRNSGLAAAYELNNNSWTQLGTVLEGEGFNHQLGWAVELSPSGEFLSVGIPGHDQFDGSANTGRVNFYRWDGNLWDTAATSLNGDSSRDEFGFSVALDENGTTLAVGATVSTGSSAGGAGYVRAYRASS